MIDLGPPPLAFPKPAIIRPATAELLRYGTDPVLGMAVLGHKLRRAAGAAKAALSSFTFIISTQSGDSASVTISASAAIGDFALCLNSATSASSAPSAVVPSGFTTLKNTSGGDSTRQSRAIVSGKILVSGDPGASRSVMNGSNESGAIMLIFRPNVPLVDGFADNSGGTQFTSGNPSLQTVAASGVSPPIIVYGHFCAINTISPRTVSPANDAEINNASAGGASTHQYVQYRIYDVGETPVDHDFDMDDEGLANGLQSGYVSFT